MARQARPEGDRSRAWYELLFRLAPKRRYTAEEAMAIVVRNWDVPHGRLEAEARFDDPPALPG